MSHNWRIGGCLVFCFFIRLITENEKTFFEEMEAQFYSKTPSASPQHLTLCRRKIVASKESLCDFYSIIPVLWYLQEFIYLSGIIISTNSSYQNYGLVMFVMKDVFPSLFSGGTLMYLCIVSDTSITFTRRKLSAMTTKIIERGETETWRDFLDQVQEEKNFSFMAWNLFPINKTFMLPFISSIITFTVLFIQLSDKLD
jgi:hypothetical protein